MNALSSLWKFLSHTKICEILSIIWFVLITSYCVPRVIHPIDEQRLSSPDHSLDAVERYYAFGGAAGESYYTIDIVEKNAVFERRPWIQTVFDYHPEVMKGKMSVLNLTWINDRRLIIHYCGYFYYFRNYKKIRYNDQDVRIDVEINDMCDH